MRIGVISDIHANEPALRAVLNDMPPVDGLACAGDVIGYNPWPAECVDALREREIPTVLGNHDRVLVQGSNFVGNTMARAGIEHARRNLSADQVDWLAGLPSQRRLSDDRVKVVHGHPDEPDRYTYPREFGPGLLNGEKALVMGHTHVQAHEVYPEGIVMNPGSVGQPRDGDPRAAYAVLDLEAVSVEERRVKYDVGDVVDAIREAGLPPATGQRLLEGR